MDVLDQIPGYREAIERENAARDLAFASGTQTVSGVETLGISLRKCILLEGGGNAFLCGGVATQADVAQFLWVVSTSYDPGNDQARSAFLRRVGSLKYTQAVDDIRGFLDDAFQDAPSGRRIEGFVPQITSSAASYIDKVASEYGWTEDTILDMHLGRLFQYIRCILKRHQPDRTFFNASDRVRGQWLEERNREAVKN